MVSINARIIARITAARITNTNAIRGPAFMPQCDRASTWDARRAVPSGQAEVAKRIAIAITIATRSVGFTPYNQLVSRRANAIELRFPRPRPLSPFADYVSAPWREVRAAPRRAPSDHPLRECAVRRCKPPRRRRAHASAHASSASTLSWPIAQEHTRAPSPRAHNSEGPQ